MARRTAAGGAKLKAASYGVAAVTNILDFLLRTERAIEERMPESILVKKIQLYYNISYLIVYEYIDSPRLQR